MKKVDEKFGDFKKKVVPLQSKQKDSKSVLCIG